MSILSSNDIVRLNVGGQQFATRLETLWAEPNSRIGQWFEIKANNPPLPVDRTGAYFIDRDADSFAVVLNYLRLKSSNQVRQACLPKDPDRLALLTQEADYYRLPELKEHAIELLRRCCQAEAASGSSSSQQAQGGASTTGYVNQMLVSSVSCPMGFDDVALRQRMMVDSMLSSTASDEFRASP